MATVSLVAAAAVQADRKPTSKERRAVAAVVDLPPECAIVRISTETPKPLWASVTFKPKSPSKCDSLASDGVTVAKRRKGHWKFVTAGSDFGCAELYKDVPQAIVDDLDIFCH